MRFIIGIIILFLQFSIVQSFRNNKYMMKKSILKAFNPDSISINREDNGSGDHLNFQQLKSLIDRCQDISACENEYMLSFWRFVQHLKYILTTLLYY